MFLSSLYCSWNTLRAMGSTQLDYTGSQEMQLLSKNWDVLLSKVLYSLNHTNGTNFPYIYICICIQLTDTLCSYFKCVHYSSLCYSLVQFHTVMMALSSSNVQALLLIPLWIYVYWLLNIPFSDEPFNLNDPEWADINIVTGCLKLYFRELPDPLIPANKFKAFIDAASK